MSTRAACCGCQINNYIRLDQHYFGYYRALLNRLQQAGEVTFTWAWCWGSCVLKNEISCLLTGMHAAVWNYPGPSVLASIRWPQYNKDQANSPLSPCLSACLPAILGHVGSPWRLSPVRGATPDFRAKKEAVWVMRRCHASGTAFE